MFISNTEKDSIKREIIGLKARIGNLESDVEWLKGLTKSKPRSAFTTEEAPWGLKLDGTPRKQPGRPTKKEEA